MTAPIVGDETFTLFRRKLEDVVTVAINSGGPILLSSQSTNRTHCPMGCLASGDFRCGTPPATVAFVPWGIEKHQALAFQRGFDCSEYCDMGDDSLRYFQLGQAYAARFP